MTSLRQNQCADWSLVIDRAGDADHDHPLDFDGVEQPDGTGAGQCRAHARDDSDHRSVADPPRVAEATLAEP